MFVGIKTCSCWICYECVQFQIEIQKISCCGSHSPNNAEFGHFMLLFCRGQQRNVPRIKTHMHSYCFALQTYCLVTFLLPLGLHKVPTTWLMLGGDIAVRTFISLHLLPFFILLLSYSYLTAQILGISFVSLKCIWQIFFICSIKSP